MEGADLEPRPEPALPYAETAGAIYAEVVKEQLADERDRKASFEQRGIAVVTTSGVLVSLLFGFATVGAKAAPLPNEAQVLLLVALGAFSLAAICGIVTNVPRKYEELDVPALERLVTKEWWDVSPADGARQVATSRLNVLRSARERNTRKGTWLTWGIGLEVLGVVILSLAVGAILRR